MLTPTLRKWTELLFAEKADIFAKMSLTQNKEERDSVRKSLAWKYWITEWSITSLIARETMRRMKNWEWTQSSSQTWEIDFIWIEWDWIDENPTQSVQESTQTRVYVITTLSEFTEKMREDIIEEFWDAVRDSTSDSMYDYYLDIEALSEYYNIEPSILEQFLRNRYSWLWTKLDELKNGRVLSEEDKLNIRLYIVSWCDEKDKKTRRKEMAKKYWVSIRVISAITAWKLDENVGGKILKKDDAQIKGFIIPEIELEPVVETLQTNNNQAEQDSLISIWDEQEDSKNNEWEQTVSKIDAVYIKDLVFEYNLQDDEQRWAFLQHVFDLFPDANIDDVKKIIPDFPDDTKHENTKRSGEWMWALVNYNNEIKNKWRQKLKEFIDENTDKEKRATMKVLCLPWVECLEIPLYLELGFKPENIVWVESANVDPKNLKPDDIEWLKKDAIHFGISFELTKKCIREILSRKFLNNASRYWIQTRIWMLEKVLEIEETTFDVVSLDFLGPISKNTTDILTKIKTSTKTLILMNYLAKREGTISKNILNFWEYLWELSEAPISKWYIPFILKADAKVGDRDSAVVNLIEGYIWSSVRWTNYFDYRYWIPWKLPLKEISTEYNRLLQVWKIDQLSITSNLSAQAKLVIWYYRSLFVQKMQSDMNNLLEKRNRTERMNHYYFEKPLTSCFYWTPFTSHIWQYKYISRVWKGPGSPFFTDLIVLERPDSDNHLLDDYVSYFTDFLATAIQAKWEVDFWLEWKQGKWIYMYYKKKKWFSRKSLAWMPFHLIYDSNQWKFHNRSILENECPNRYTEKRVQITI